MGNLQFVKIIYKYKNVDPSKSIYYFLLSVNA